MKISNDEIIQILSLPKDWNNSDDFFSAEFINVSISSYNKHYKLVILLYLKRYNSILQ